VTGDVNGDGIADLVVANQTGSSVSIRLGTGLGSFSGTTNVAVSGGAFDVALGDFNRDGRLDLAVPSNATVAVVLATGSPGSFGSPTYFPVGSFPIAVAAADFNRDGNLDLAVANLLSATVSILMGQGTGSFAAKVDVNAGPTPRSLAAADFNHDGKIDLAVANQSSKAVSILLNSVFYDVTMTLAGTGSGTVTSSPDGITCGSDCTEAYPVGQAVRLTGVPAAGHFAGLTGGGCAGPNPCTITVTANTTVTATFSATSFTFQDDPLTARVTLVKAAHILDLRAAINNLRATYGPSQFTFADPDLSNTTIQALHFTQMRLALDDVYTQRGRTPPSYGAITAGQTFITAAHIEELRFYVRAIE
jgi:hypothetical protein